MWGQTQQEPKTAPAQASGRVCKPDGGKDTWRDTLAPARPCREGSVPRTVLSLRKYLPRPYSVPGAAQSTGGAMAKTEPQTPPS